MIRLQGLRLRPGEPESQLLQLAKKQLGTEPKGFVVLKKSLDARKKEDIAFVYTIAVEAPGEEKILRRCKNASRYTCAPYQFPVQHLHLAQRPVIVGSGPAGLFCALMLARIGARPIVLERGWDVDRRVQAVSDFWSAGRLDPECNVQFGEGGAGTFSDGKLNTSTHDPRLRFVLEQFAIFGAPREILYDAAPHVGTDKLRSVVKNIRQLLLQLGAEVRFGHRLSGIRTENGHITGAAVSCPEGDYFLPTGHLVLALGHSARDTFEMLQDAGVPMAQKPFAMGVRIEHRQADISFSQYGGLSGVLPPASYKLSCHPHGDRGVFSFCVCPGGQVVGAASEPGRLCTNGMSNYARDGEKINGGLLVSVGPADFGTDHPLGGMRLQRQLEARAYELGGGNYAAPCQRVEDFLRHIPSAGPGKVLPSYRPGVTWTDLHLCLPSFITSALEEAIPLLGQKLKGFDDPDALLTAVESRSSSPVRILRDETGQSAIRGLFPCGEGAGYAGGILSAAVDGIRTAQWICDSAL